MASEPIPPNPFLLIAELSYRCPLHCPYCSNPLEIGHDRYRDELSTEDWARVFRQAAELGVLQLALTGGEPLARKDLEELTAVAAAAGLYSTLVTAGTLFTQARATALLEAGLDHVQISIQDSDPIESDLMAGVASYGKKIEAARLARELGFPLTINVVLHRRNLDRIDAIISLAEELGARRLELANTQYHGWALPNRAALMPSREQLEAGERAVQRARERLGPKMEILWVLPDYYEELPKPCMGGWGREAMLVTPNGDGLPCQSASTIPGLTFENVRERSLSEIWFESDAFQRFRGTDWMLEPCRSCPLERQHADFGGCRCQAMALTGDPAATDPVCHLSPHHDRIVEQRIDVAADDADAPLVYRTTRSRPVRALDRT
jgi:pyrroloquinoline quinone biosynthesis protein E